MIIQVYPGKPHPCKSDFSFDQELLDAIGAASVEKRMEGFPPSADIFRPAIVRYHSNAVEPRTYPNGELCYQRSCHLVQSIIIHRTIE